MDSTPRYCSATGVLLATAAATVIPGLPELREGEVYVIDDSSYSGNDDETFGNGTDLAERLSELANDRDMGTNDWSCHHDRPKVYIRREADIDFSVTHSIKFGA